MDTEMNTSADHATLYSLIRNYMDVMGASRTTLVALKSYMDAVLRLRCENADFGRRLQELNTVIKNTQPKVMPLVHLIEEFEAELAPSLKGEAAADKNRAIDILSRKLKLFEADTARLTANCVHCIEAGDFIIAHSPTDYTRKAFVDAHIDKRRKFKVLVLKQDFIRTKQLVATLEEYAIEHLVIPEYNLSHYLDEVNKLFISAVSISADRKAVTGVGTANVAGLCHVRRIPIYLFVESIKFAHTSLPEQRIYKEEQEKVEEDYTFRMTTFSHDIVDLSQVDHIITEKGEHPAGSKPA